MNDTERKMLKRMVSEIVSNVSDLQAEKQFYYENYTELQFGDNKTRIAVLEAKIAVLGTLLNSLFPTCGWFWFECLTDPKTDFQRDQSRMLVQGRFNQLMYGV